MAGESGAGWVGSAGGQPWAPAVAGGSGCASFSLNRPLGWKPLLARQADFLEVVDESVAAW